jgi:hypothetical protein
MENKFAGLSLEDVAELSDDEATDEIQLPVVTPVLLKQDENEIEEELKFAIGLLFDELHNIRTVACEQWKKYKDKQVDLIVAAMTTDTTVKLAQKAEAEFDLVVLRPKKYPTTTYPVWKLLDVIAKPSATRQSRTEEDKNRHGDLFWPTYIGLKKYLGRISNWNSMQNLPAIVPQDFGDRQPHDYTLRAIELAQITRITMFGKRPAVKDMHFQALEHMFDSKQLPIWATFAVELLFRSQDILGDARYRSFIELALHLQKLVVKSNRMLEEHKGVAIPLAIYDDVFKKLGMALQDCQDWVLFDGYPKQWRELSKKTQLATHPVLKKLLKGDDKELKYPIYDPILCGMLKYDIYLKYQSAGLKLEHQTLAIAMPAWIYIAARLETKAVGPTWPDMEYLIYGQDPEWLFVGGKPKTIQEVKSKFRLASGSSAVNSARDIRIDRLRGNVNKLRELRDTTVFGRGVYLPSDKFKTSEYSVSTAKIENVFKRLADTMNGPQPWGRLARNVLKFQDEHAQEQEQKAKFRQPVRMGNAHDILSSYA